MAKDIDQDQTTWKCLRSLNAFYLLSFSFTDLLLNHVVNGTFYTGGLKTGDVLTTLGGMKLTIVKNGNSKFHSQIIMIMRYLCTINYIQITISNLHVQLDH